MKDAQILHDIVLPHLLKHEGFKKALVDAVSEIPITELETITSELSKRKTLTIGTLPEASDTLRANMIVEMIVKLKDAVEAYAEKGGKV